MRLSLQVLFVYESGVLASLYLRFVTENTGVVDDNIDAAPLVDDLLDDLVTFSVGVVVGDGLTTSLGDFLDDDIGGLLVLILSRGAKIVDKDLCSARSEEEGVSAASQLRKEVIGAYQVVRTILLSVTAWSAGSRVLLSSYRSHIVVLEKGCHSRFTKTVTGTSDDDDTALERDLSVLGGREVRHFGRVFVRRAMRL